MFEKEAPIKVSQEKEGHGKDIGIKVGWELTHIDNFGAGEARLGDVRGWQFSRIDKKLHLDLSLARTLTACRLRPPGRVLGPRPGCG